jgi:predicted DNA-binding transcriptional regulator AlpA
MIRVKELGRALSMRRTKLYKLIREGWIPAAVEIDGTKLWRVAELDAWAMAGCPHVKQTDWQWVKLVKIETYLHVISKEIIDLNREKADLEKRLAEGEEVLRLATSTVHQLRGLEKLAQ